MLVGHNVVVFYGGGVSQVDHVPVQPAVLPGYLRAWESTAPMCVPLLISSVGLGKAVPASGFLAEG